MRKVALTDDLRRAAGFGRYTGREAVAELRRVGGHFPPAVAGVGVRRKAEVADRRLRVEVEERLGATEGEARPLNEGAVCVECLRRIKRVLVLRPTAI